MAQIFPYDIYDSPSLSQISHDLCRIFEKNLSDEWECHAILSGSKISHLIVVSADLGVLVLLISECLPNQFDSFFQRIPDVLEKHLIIIRNELQKHEQLCDENGVLNFPIGSGILFPELSVDELSIKIGTLSDFSIFADKLKKVSNNDDELEELLFDMVEEFDFGELSQENLKIINHDAIPQMNTLLINELGSTDNNKQSEIPDKEETHPFGTDTLQQDTSNFLKNKKENEMQVSRGIDTFINHLELLGYKFQKQDTENDDIIVYSFQQIDENNNFFLVHIVNINVIQLRFILQLPHEIPRLSLLNAINNFNSTNLFICSYISDNEDYSSDNEDYSLIYELTIPEVDDKIVIDRIFGFFHSGIQELAQVLTKMYGGAAVDMLQDLLIDLKDLIAEQDDIPNELPPDSVYESDDYDPPF